MPERSKEDLQRVLDVLNEEVLDDEESEEILDELQIDVASAAADLRVRLQAAKARMRSVELEEDHEAFLEAQARLDQVDAEPVRTLEEQRHVLRDLVRQAGSRAGAHFQKFEHADPEELAAMIASLRHLLAEDED